MDQEIKIRPLDQTDLKKIDRILSDWLSKEEVDHYLDSIQAILSDPSPTPKFDSHYYVAVLDDQVVGLSGFRQPNPKLLQFAHTQAPAELCMLYMAKEHRGKGIGKSLLNHVVHQVQKRHYQELIVRSAKKFINTGWGFYDKMGFARVGQLDQADDQKVSQIWFKKIFP